MDDEFNQEMRIDDLEHEVEKLKIGYMELRTDVDSMKITIETSKQQMDELGRYAERTRDELLEMKGSIRTVIATLEASFKNMSSSHPDYEDTKSALYRARHNRTRIETALSNIPVIH